jgi:hypothetical protein
MFGVRTTTIARWAREGYLKSLTTPGGHRRYRRADIADFRNSAFSDPTERQRLEADAVRMYEQGWSIRRVAEEFNASYGMMRRLLMRKTTLRDRSGR